MNETSHPEPITANGITKSFHGVPVLRGVDLTVRRGEVLVVMGPSGSGKTTLIRCLNGLEHPESGEIRVCRQLNRSSSRRFTVVSGVTVVLARNGPATPCTTLASRLRNVERSSRLHREEGEVRFFGNGHRITDNTIFDISDSGYANPPHPDCFQTYDQNSPPTFDVVISGNTCRNVGAQCLIDTGDQRVNGGAPRGVPSIIFVGNTCASNGAQAINLRRWPNVEIRQNKLSGPNLTRGIIIIDGSTGTTVIGNSTDAGRLTVDIDGSSRPA